MGAALSRCDDACAHLLGAEEGEMRIPPRRQRLEDQLWEMYLDDERWRGRVTLPQMNLNTQEILWEILEGTLTAQRAATLVTGAELRVIVQIGDSYQWGLVELIMERRPPLPEACEIIDLLLQAGAPDVTAGDPSSLKHAITRGKYDVATVMLRHVNQNSPNLLRLHLLHVVARENHDIQPAVKLAMVSSLVELHPGQLLERDRNHRLPIHEFCRHPLSSEAAQEGLIDLLVRDGDRYTLNTTDRAGATPLQLAASDLNASGLLRGLLRHGANLWSAGVPRSSRLGRVEWMQRVVDAHLAYLRHNLLRLVRRSLNRALQPLWSIRAATDNGILREIKMKIAGYMCNAIPLYLPAPLRHRISKITRLFITAALERTTAGPQGAC
ncbi:unnamed protein product [Vitrella brassicaformis CCMP3155]|uniref:Uncharacterized protein n=1 Tax=Vitrella brassicaformis (strain CCMP3155) TaxID=1169540 RepID=A0A0G4EG04_VITBC|nr:unnamed protein product [Vitrella brassicaformis CCMP3155]|eukprot:CEL95456.1 unnamed protein product [Vitrella brassicaformis CCMP3155]